MLICNLIEEYYTILKKKQYGIDYCTDTFYTMFLQQFGLYLGCSGVVLCYTPEICEDTSINCSSLSITQDTILTPCSLTIT